jgi:hypothetical protein
VTVSAVRELVGAALLPDVPPDTFDVTEFGYVESDIVSLLSQDGLEDQRLAGEKVCIAA